MHYIIDALRCSLLLILQFENQKLILSYLYFMYYFTYYWLARGFPQGDLESGINIIPMYLLIIFCILQSN